MNKRNILITGGNFSNKGAQSMVFVTVHEMKKRFPNHNILVVSGSDFKRNDTELEMYSFEIIDNIFKMHFANGLYGKVKNTEKKNWENSKKILKNTDLLIDISGYALGSDWSLASNLFYISKIKTAKKYGVKIYILPQSFGPFNFRKGIRQIIDRMIRNSFSKAEKIYARENNGFDLLTRKYKLNNVSLSPDLVLQNKEINLQDIYNNMPKINPLNIDDNSVGIVPNMKSFQHGNKDEVINLYKDSINNLLKIGKKIYIVRHSTEDIEACEIIKNEFINNDEVTLLADEYSSIEFGKIVSNFDYIIGSRYHSIVHAYKVGVPCIALGWAIKYHELLGRFNQSDYIFDVRNDINIDNFLRRLNQMNNNFSEESDKIYHSLKKIRKENIFDSITL